MKDEPRVSIKLSTLRLLVTQLEAEQVERNHTTGIIEKVVKEFNEEIDLIRAAGGHDTQEYSGDVRPTPGRGSRMES